MTDNKNKLNCHYWFVPRPLGGEVTPMETYKLLFASPDRIERWIKIIDCNEPGVTKVLSLSSVNGEYIKKIIAFKWVPDLKEKTFVHIVLGH
jgi:hypothetical protein